jgi:tousled-like kinase
MSESLLESWEDGSASLGLRAEYDALKCRREKLEQRQKDSRKAARKIGAAKPGEMPPPPPPSSSDPYGALPVTDELSAMEAEESVRMHLGNAKREETVLLERERALEREKIIHIRNLKRVSNEDQSRFAPRPKLHNRDVLLSLLGTGGFSEVRPPPPHPPHPPPPHPAPTPRSGAPTTSRRWSTSR